VFGATMGVHSAVFSHLRAAEHNMFAYIALLITLGCAAAQMQECNPTQCTLEKLTMEKMEFDMKKMRYDQEDVRMLREIYVEDRTGSKNVQSTEFKVDEFATEVGYKFIYKTGVRVPSKMFKYEKVPVVVGRNVSMVKRDVSHMYVEQEDCFYERYSPKRISGKFTCSHMMNSYVKCMVMETRFVFHIPFIATMKNEEERCQCKCNGTFRRHANPSYRYVVDKVGNTRRQF